MKRLLKNLMKKYIFFILKYIGDLRILNNSLYNLENRLFDGYQSNILPVQNANTIVIVSIDFTLLQLIQMA